MFKVSLKTFGPEVVYKHPAQGQEKPSKFKLPIYGKGFFDSVSRFCLKTLSHVFSGLKPCRVSIGTRQVGKMFATRRKIEQFLFNESKAFLHQSNQGISDQNLKNNIREALSQLDMNEKIQLPKLVEAVHKKSMRDYGVIERGLYSRLADYIDRLPDAKKELPIPFSVSADGTIGAPGIKKAVSMQVVIENNQLILQPAPEAFAKGLPLHAQILYKAFELEGQPDISPSAILRSAVEANLANEFTSFLKGEMPKGLDYSQVQEVYLKTDGNNKPMGMHKISLNGNHYIASPIWPQQDAAKFWTSVLEQKPAVIVKLTPDIPSREEPLYWPNKVGAKWTSDNPLVPSITCKSIQKINKDLVKRVFELRTKDETFQIAQLDFLGWEDMSVPSKMAFVNLMAEVDKACPKSTPDRRILVHCKGGIGRTGTFITAHAAKETPAGQRSETMYYDMIMDLRRQRPLPMVETAEQYLFLRQVES